MYHLLLPKFIPEKLNILCVVFRNNLTSLIIVVFGVVFVFCFVYVWKVCLRDSNFITDNIKVFLEVFKFTNKI